MKNYHLIDNPLIKKDITILRDKVTNHNDFRRAIYRISLIMAVEISNEFGVTKFDVETPLEKTEGFKISHDIILVAVLRAGLSMVNPFLEIIPESKVGHIGIQRNEITLEPIDYYYKVPPSLETAKVILLDPMLATGGSSSVALNYLKKSGMTDCIFASVIAAPQGVERINRDHPEVKIYMAALDRTLNEKGYILPGLGDAGDRTFGTL